MVKYWTIVFLFLSGISFGQGGFTASIVGGATLSQIDGDMLYGYDKLGMTAGLKVGYDLDSRWMGHIEMLYSQRGSNNNFGIGGKKSAFIHTDYIEVPVLVNLRDWYVNDANYYRASVHAGVSTAYLFQVKSNITSYENNVDNYNRVDISWVLGASFRLNKSIGITIRYTRALGELRKEAPSAISPKGIQYFWTIRSEYNF